MAPKRLTVLAATAAFALQVQALAPAIAEERTLATVHAKVLERYKSVRHVSAREMEALDRENLVIFDVREDDEFAVSHLSDAIRVDPDVTPAEFMAKFSRQIAGKTVLVYCSVGVRSSALAARLHPYLKKGGDNRIYNLTGGIFQWHNDGRPLARGAQSTPYVHPYDNAWGRLISNRALISYSPKP